jgi:hypothetical protein
MVFSVQIVLINKNQITIQLIVSNVLQVRLELEELVVKKWFYLDTLEEENIIKIKNKRISLKKNKKE